MYGKGGEVHTPCVNGCHFSGVSFFGALFLCVPYHDIKGGHTACLKVKHPAAGTKCLFSWIPGWMRGCTHLKPEGTQKNRAPIKDTPEK